jgi:hypothetical protein
MFATESPQTGTGLTLLESAGMAMEVLA